MANIVGYNRKLIGLIKKNGLLAEEELAKLQAKASTENKLLASILVEENLLDEMTLLGLVSEDSGVPPLDLNKIKLDIDEMKPFNKGVEPMKQDDAKRFCCLPMFISGDYMTMAVANPYDVVALDDLKLTVGKSILPVVSTERSILKAIESTYNAQAKALNTFMEGIKDDGELMMDAKDGKPEEEKKNDKDITEANGNDSPSVKLVNMIILQAIQKKASDIHIEPFEKRVRVRFRIDGVCHEVMNPPKKMEQGICSRIKIMTDTMNISEKRKPQDGRFQIKLQGKAIDFRVSSLPTVHGEKMCMRILDKSNLAGSLESLNFEPAVLDIIRRCIGAPYGMFLVTGPTGSGKSTTLYSCLQAVMTVEENVTTVEEPVEYEIEGLNQVHINPKAGLTFPAALRALLRQDPDTIMIGEIRDQETIEIAVKAALTGHLVLSTLHTNDAPSTINRIIDMGIEPLMVANTILAVTAQRLGRRLCKACKKKMEKEEYPPIDQLKAYGYTPEEIETLELWHAPGCTLCNHGYKGRFGLVECLEMTNPIRKIIIKGGSNIDIRNVGLENGMVTLRRAGLMNVARGVTSLEEVLRSTISEEE